MAVQSNAIVRLGLESNQYEKGLRQAQRQWQEFTRALGVNIGKVTAIGVAIGAVTGALKVAKDAFFKNEQQLDEWGRTVKSAQSLYAGFLNSLNNGSISGYLTNINNIVRAAREAYDALDALGTFNAFNQINVERGRTNMTEAIADYREGTGSKEAVQASAEAYKKELLERQKLEQQAYEKAVHDVAQQRRISGDVMLRIMQSDYATLEQYKGLGLSGREMVWQSNGQFGGTSTYQKAVAATEQEEIGEALRNLNDTELQYLQSLGAQAQRTSTEIANIDKQVARVLRGGNTTTGGGGGTTKAVANEVVPLAGSIDAQVQKVKELQDAFNAAGSDGIRMGLLPQLKEAEQTLERMRNLGNFAATTPTGIPGTELSAIPTPEVDDSAMEKARALVAIGEQNAEAWRAASGAIGAVGQALEMIEDPAAKVAGLIAQAIATIASTFAASLKGTFTPWDWIAGAAAGTATMISTIAAIKQATAGSYAEGGIVPGNNYSDGLIARVSSGELILNQAQQGALASQLQEGSPLGRLNLQTTISGEQIRIVLNNNSRRTGRGEYITSK